MAMPPPLLADAFGHHVWATIRVLDVCAALDDAQLATTVPGTYGSILDTLRHLVDGDVSYMNVLRGGESEPFNKGSSDISTMRAAMEAHEAAWQRLIAGDLDPTTVVVAYEASGYETHAPPRDTARPGALPRDRSPQQVCTALTSLDTEPPVIEVWDFTARDGRMFTIDRIDRIGRTAARVVLGSGQRG
jgi:hypothetical protein